MDRNRFSAIAHRHHAFSNPINETKLMKMIELVSLKPSHHVIDVGAGKCELLIRLVEKYSISAKAIELYVGAITEAKSQAKQRVSAESIDFICADAKEAVLQCPHEEYDLGICIGSTHALGGLKSTLDMMQRLVKKGGYIFVGEGYWKQKPSSEYLAALGGADESELTSHAKNVMLGEEIGLIPQWSYVANEDDWDEYEWLYSLSVENYCHENPKDPDVESMLERIRLWRQTYLKWGRDTLGFGLYLFRK
ncbi:SAM-dependent methyltransferase [Bacillus marasmi]|uniref:SAM-dependent methyltransferase n=1 Tax=Bacillus marasmi TaxID=1926279 RepID=UPI0011CAB527|nr:class I SAM-dependent methyltransferase [Bacillus marasmi]